MVSDLDNFLPQREQAGLLWFPCGPLVPGRERGAAEVEVLVVLHGGTGTAGAPVCVEEWCFSLGGHSDSSAQPSKSSSLS